MAPDEIRKTRSTRRYRKWRLRVLSQEPLCRPCGKAGFTVAAEELDHIVPLSVAPEGLWDKAAVQPICRPCHEAKSAEENRIHIETSARAAWRKRVEGMM